MIAAMRNTPTCVGKTTRVSTTSNALQKHPHVRGEDQRRCNPDLQNRETPPRAWGRLINFFAVESKIRNTPTCVGKTTKADGYKMSYEKHPHVRGEDKLTPARNREERETPPRAWGRHQHIVKEREFNHNIHVLRQF